MQTQNETQIRRNNSSFAKLLTGWLIISLSYVLIRIVFIIFGLISKSALGGCLAIIPYLFGALYFGKSCASKGAVFYTLGVLLPAVVEKIVLYLLGTFLYNISPAKITSVLDAISSHEPYVNLFTHPDARYFINISFFGWAYVLVSLSISALLVLLLVNARRGKTYG